MGMIVIGGTQLFVRRPETRQERADWLHRLCARALRELGIEIRVMGVFPERGTIISNHLSYADIIVFAAIHPCVFVSKAEVERWPVIGWMTTMSGAVYVSRGHGGSALKAGAEVRAVVDAGLPVVFFPEGTTSNGTGLLKFHSGLLAQVIDAGSPVTAAYVRYGFSVDNGHGLSVEDDVCYWGDRNMWAHIFKFLGLRGVRAEVRFADAPIEFATWPNRKQAAVEARSEMMALSVKA
jgi:1-acyl-sn-glycerol-3-phosphate acyltransferase